MKLPFKFKNKRICSKILEGSEESVPEEEAHSPEEDSLEMHSSEEDSSEAYSPEEDSLEMHSSEEDSSGKILQRRILQRRILQRSKTVSKSNQFRA
ncbi:MAG: hypothetical protein ACYSQZ_10165 [Planctomycetota bacterium]